MEQRFLVLRNGVRGGEFRTFNLVTTTAKGRCLSAVLSLDTDLYVKPFFDSDLPDDVSSVVVEQVSQFGNVCLVRLYSQDIHIVVKIMGILMENLGETYALKIIAERSVLVGEYPGLTLMRHASVLGVPGIVYKVSSISTDSIVEFMFHKANYTALPVKYGPLRELYHAPHVTKIEHATHVRIENEAEEEVQKVSKKLVMPHLIVSKVIGRGGCLINAIRKETQAQIIVHNVDVNKVFWQDILVQGTEEQVTLALTKIRALAKR